MKTIQISGWTIEQDDDSRRVVIAEPSGRTHMAYDTSSSSEMECVLSKLCKALLESDKVL